MNLKILINYKFQVPYQKILTVKNQSEENHNKCPWELLHKLHNEKLIAN